MSLVEVSTVGPLTGRLLRWGWACWVVKRIHPEVGSESYRKGEALWIKLVRQFFPNNTLSKIHRIILTYFLASSSTMAFSVPSTIHMAMVAIRQPPTIDLILLYIFGLESRIMRNKDGGENSIFDSCVVQISHRRRDLYCPFSPDTKIGTCEETA